MSRGDVLKYLVILALLIVVPPVLPKEYFRYLIFLSCVFAILALSADIIISGAGLLTFGHQAFFGIGAYTSGALNFYQGVEPLVGFLAAFVVSGVSGILFGYICLRRLRAVYLAIATFGLGAVVFLIARNWYQFTGGLTGLRGLDYPSLFGFEINSELRFCYLGLALLLLTSYFIYRLWHSRLGRAIIALRENEELARSKGVSPIFYYTVAFSIACAFAGLSGALYVHEMAVVNPMLFQFNYMIIIFIAVLVGGKGRLPGPIIGATIYVCLTEFLRFAENLRYALMGVILLIVVTFMPSGVYPFLLSQAHSFTNFIKQWLRRKGYGTNP